MSRGKILAGIDIGSSKIATIIAQLFVAPDSEGIQVLGVSSIPSQGVRKGQIVDIEEVARVVISSVEKAERMAGFTVDRAAAVINGGHISCQNSHGVVAVSSPEGEIEPGDVDRVIDAARAISLPAAREIIHVLPSEFIVDGEIGIKDPVGMSAVRLEVETHLVTASSTALKNLNKCVNEVGAHLSGVVFSGFASAHAVLTDTERELGVVLVDFGGGTTSIAVFISDALVHSRVLPIGAKNITNDIAIGLRTSLESAEKIKIALSTLPKIFKDKKVDPNAKDDEIDIRSLGIEDSDKAISRKTLVEGIIKPRLNEVFTMVGMELKSAGLAGRTPAGLVLTGGGALTAGVAESAKRMLALPVRIGSPHGITGLIDDVSSPVFASTVGSILWASRIPSMGGSPMGLGNIAKNLENKILMKGIIGKMVDVVKGLLP